MKTPISKDFFEAHRADPKHNMHKEFNKFKDYDHYKSMMETYKRKQVDDTKGLKTAMLSSFVSKTDGSEITPDELLELEFVFAQSIFVLEKYKINSLGAFDVYYSGFNDGIRIGRNENK